MSKDNSALLNEWWLNQKQNYVSKERKIIIARLVGISLSQLEDWIKNKKRNLEVTTNKSETMVCKYKCKFCGAILKSAKGCAQHFIYKHPTGKRNTLEDMVEINCD